MIEHATRRIRILGVTLHPTGEWTAQQVRNLIMDPGEQTHRVKFIIRDPAPDYTAACGPGRYRDPDRALQVRTPRMNAIAERRTGGYRRELLDRTLIWNQACPQRILQEYQTQQDGLRGEVPGSRISFGRHGCRLCSTAS